MTMVVNDQWEVTWGKKRKCWLNIQSRKTSMTMIDKPLGRHQRPATGWQSWKWPGWWSRGETRAQIQGSHGEPTKVEEKETRTWDLARPKKPQRQHIKEHELKKKLPRELPQSGRAWERVRLPHKRQEPPKCSNSHAREHGSRGDTRHIPTHQQGQGCKPEDKGEQSGKRCALGKKHLLEMKGCGGFIWILMRF